VIYCGDSVAFENEADISVYRSSSGVVRGFFRECGSHLFYRYEDNQHMMLAGLFDSRDDFVFETQYYFDDKPGYCGFENDTHNFPGTGSV
jgi:hypothetical protein